MLDAETTLTMLRQVRDMGVRSSWTFWPRA